MSYLPDRLDETPTSLVAVEGQCIAVEQWAADCESVAELRDATNKLAAIDEYLSRTSSQERARVAATMRRLETRVGSLLGPASANGKSPGSNATDPGLTKDQRSKFRELARHADVVEDVIEQSTDEDPASRRKIQREIKKRTGRAPEPKVAGAIKLRP